MRQQKYINVNRTFSEILIDKEPDDATALSGLRDRAKVATWADLLGKKRVVILAEAGAGKTREMRETCRRIRKEGKKSFFIRLEHLSHDFKSSFDEGTYKQFNEWLSSNGQSWIFLDSVDEARLRGPKDFEHAIRKFSSIFESGKSRCHLFVSGRISEWRPQSDWDLVCDKLGLPSAQKSLGDETEDSHDGKANDFLNIEESTDPNPVDIFTICDLNEAEIQLFCEKLGATNTAEFMEQLGKHDAIAFAARPQDLMELIEYWNKNGTVGGRYERVFHSVKKRLTEDDPDRSNSRDLSTEKSFEGAKLLAAAVTLTKLSRLRIPDSRTENSIDVREVLKDWSVNDCSALLDRPIFDESIYGTVQFHHRVVREFLTAQWLLDLLAKDGSREKIEKLIFANQYDCKVVVPTMQSIVPWVAIEDENILNRLIEISPDILIDYGDPSKLPLPARITILKAFCKQQRSYRNYWNINRAGLVRFAKPDLAPTIRGLLGEYHDCNEVVDLLLELIVHGELEKLKAEVLSICVDPEADKYSIVWAIRALAKIGCDHDHRKCVEQLVAKPTLSPGVLGELLESFPHLLTPNQVVNCSSQFSCSEDYQNHALKLALVSYVKNLKPKELFEVVEEIVLVLKREPFISEACPISAEFSWLIEPCVKAVENLVREKSLYSLEEPILEFLHVFSSHDKYGGGRNLDHQLGELIQNFEDLNRKLFWHAILIERDSSKKRIEYWWQARHVNHFFGFSDKDFNFFIDELSNQSDDDNKLVALSLTFTIYKDSGRPKKGYRTLKRVVKGKPHLESRLHEFFHPEPKSDSEKQLDRQQNRWERKRKAREEKQKKQKSSWVAHIRKNKNTLRDVSIAADGTVWNMQRYLLDDMRRLGGHQSKWGHSNYRDLIPTYGVEVANAFRDGLVEYWRKYTAKLRSEGIENPNSVPIAISVSLSGLAIESQEVKNWPKNLSKKEAVLATRLALREMNGIPSWLEQLYEEFSEQVHDVIAKELKWELETKQDSNSSYVINSIRWGGKWLQGKLADELFSFLQSFDAKNQAGLSDCLWIIDRSASVTGEQITELAKQKLDTDRQLREKAMWLALWVDADCKNAMGELEATVKAINDSGEAQDLVVQFLHFLIGDSGRAFFSNRMSFNNAEFLYRLYLLAKKYVRHQDDLDRSDQCYTPTPRDDAQRARNSLVNLLCQTPGKKAYQCLVDLAEISESDKKWLQAKAYSRATLDADLVKWDVSDVHSFNKDFEHDPHTHRELFNLVVSRLGDLKIDLEEGDSSEATILITIDQETEHRKYIGNWLRNRANGKYSVPQEEELADAKRPDFRIHAAELDAPVPIELKIADNKWTGSNLVERLENQLIGDYLRDRRSNCGVYLLLFRGKKSFWKIDGHRGQRINFERLIDILQQCANELVVRNEYVEEVQVLGIDLTQRAN